MRQIRSKQTTTCVFVILACFCFSMSGCGNKQKFPDGMPVPQPTVITVIQDDKPLESASIALIPMDPSNSWNAGAVTDATGKASLKTLTKYEGVVPGKYYILITKRELGQSKITPPDPETDPQGYAKYLQESSSAMEPSYDLVDLKFSKISPSTETIEVTAGTNEKTIDVGKAVRDKR